MPSTTLKRRRAEENVRGKSAKKTKRSKAPIQYHSSSEEDEPTQDTDSKAVDLKDTDHDKAQDNQDEHVQRSRDEGAGDEAEDKTEDEIEDASGEDAVIDGDTEATDATDGTDASSVSESEASTNATAKKRKRNNPDAFATSMSKILSSKLSTSKRADPVLSRSKEASTASKELADSKLEAKARHKLREEKRAALDKGRVRDVLGLESADTPTAAVMEEERRLKKTAQRGVVKLFNAVRAAQVKGEEVAREARKTGVVGIGKREEKVNDMSKKGFLDLIAGGGKKAPVEA